AVNVYGNWKSSFKPAAPNLQEPEGAKILDPERTHSLEGGVKLRGLSRQLGLDVSGFDMTFENMVVSTLAPGGSTPVFVNAGRERFKGVEVELPAQPKAVPGPTIGVGYATNVARCVAFTSGGGEGTLREVRGKQMWLVPG